MILTDKDRLKLSNESSHGLDDFEFIGVIEAAILDKLREGVEPVAWGAPDAEQNIVETISPYEKQGGMSMWAEQYKVPLYIHPSADAQDAARYRWLRDTQNSATRESGEFFDRAGVVENIMVIVESGCSEAPHAIELDAAIDAAMKGEA